MTKSDKNDTPQPQMKASWVGYGKTILMGVELTLLGLHSFVVFGAPPEGGVGVICRSQFEAATQDPSLRLRKHLGLSKKALSEWFQILRDLPLPAHGGFVLYGSRTHHLWHGRMDLDVRMLLPRDHFGAPPSVRILDVATRQLQQFSQQYEVEVDANIFGYWGNAALSSLLYHDILPGASQELHYLSDLEEVWSKVLEYGILNERMDDLEAEGESVRAIRSRLRSMAQDLENEPLFRHARNVHRFPDLPFSLTGFKEREAFRDPMMEMAVAYGLSPRAAQIPFLTLDVVFILEPEFEDQVEPLRRLGYRHVYRMSDLR